MGSIINIGRADSIKLDGITYSRDRLIEIINDNDRLTEENALSRVGERYLRSTRNYLIEAVGQYRKDIDRLKKELETR